jgi:putative oxidoreductase
MNELNGLKKYSVWVFSGLLTAAFLMAGSLKITGSEEMVLNFQRWGFPLFFLYVVGFFEVALAIGLWLPKTAGISALGLVGMMAGGVGTHLIAGEFNAVGPAIVLGILASIVFWIRFPQIRDLYFHYRKAVSEKAYDKS